MVSGQILSRSGDRPGAAIDPGSVRNPAGTPTWSSSPRQPQTHSRPFPRGSGARRLYVYKSLPDESGAHPDLVYNISDGAWDNALWGDTFVPAGNRTLLVWKTLPLDGKAADVTFNGQVGTTSFRRFSGVALDDRYLYASDPDSQKIHVFRGIPSATDAPAFSLDLPDAARLDSDGTWLVVTRTTTNSAPVIVYRVADLAAGATGATVPFSRVRPNLPQYAAVHEGRLFVGDTTNNRVLSWTRMEDALAGRDPDLVLGTSDLSSAPQARIGKNTFFWPGAPVFDGRYLWVGEFKFSERLLRFGGFGAAGRDGAQLRRPRGRGPSLHHC